jgi:hypothetical protein
VDRPVIDLVACGLAGWGALFRRWARSRWAPRWLREHRALKGIPKMTDHLIEAMAENGRLIIKWETQERMADAVERDMMEWDED